MTLRYAHLSAQHNKQAVETLGGKITEILAASGGSEQAVQQSTDKTLDFQNNNGIIKTNKEVTTTKTTTGAVLKENAPGGFLKDVDDKTDAGGVA